MTPGFQFFNLDFSNPNSKKKKKISKMLFYSLKSDRDEDGQETV